MRYVQAVEGERQLHGAIQELKGKQRNNHSWDLPFIPL